VACDPAEASNAPRWTLLSSQTQSNHPVSGRTLLSVQPTGREDRMKLPTRRGEQPCPSQAAPAAPWMTTATGISDHHAHQRGTDEQTSRLGRRAAQTSQERDRGRLGRRSRDGSRDGGSSARPALPERGSSRAAHPADGDGGRHGRRLRSIPLASTSGGARDRDRQGEAGRIPGPTGPGSVEERARLSHGCRETRALPLRSAARVHPCEHPRAGPCVVRGPVQGLRSAPRSLCVRLTSIGFRPRHRISLSRLHA
jgi:hypothetical protein